jgi:hypothetical protein
MTNARFILTLAAAVVMAVIGYFAIVFSCPYSVLSTIMTGRVMVPGVVLGVPYRTLLAVDISVILWAIYAWARGLGPRRPAKPFADPPLLATVGVGIALIGFLSVIYPCPYAMDMWLLFALDIPVGGIFIPYWGVLAAAAGLLLYAMSLRAMRKRSADAF